MSSRLFPLIAIILPFLLSFSAQAEEDSYDWQKQIDSFFGKYAVQPLVSFLFWEIPGTEHKINISPVFEFSSENLKNLTGKNYIRGLYSPVVAKSKSKLSIQSIP